MVLITGVINNPDGTPYIGSVEFALNDLGIDPDTLYLPTVVSVESDGTITVDLWPNTHSLTATYYKCSFDNGTVFNISIPGDNPSYNLGDVILIDPGTLEPGILQRLDIIEDSVGTGIAIRVGNLENYTGIADNRIPGIAIAGEYPNTVAGTALKVSKILTIGDGLTGGTYRGDTDVTVSVDGTVIRATDARLSDAREWSAPLVPISIAQAGTDNNRYAWSALRVRQAIESWANTYGSTGGIDTVNNKSGPNVTITKVDIGLGNVPNIDTTNANNITSGKISPNRLLFGSAPGFITEGNDSRLSDAREWVAQTAPLEVVSQPDNNTRYAWTPQRIWETTGSWFSTIDSDDLPEGSDNLYYADSRVATNPAVQANTNKVSATGPVTTHSDITSAGSGQIISNIERNKLGNIEDNAQANTVISVSGRTGEVVLYSNDVGLGNVPNIDTTNANNITSGTLSGSRLPYGTVANTTAQGNDSRLSDAREWVAQTAPLEVVSQPGNNTRYAWTPQRIWETTGSWFSTIDSDDLPEGSGNLYYTDSRVATNPAVQANTNKVSATGPVTTHSDITSAGSGQIISNIERNKLGNIEDNAQANTVISVSGRTGEVVLYSNDVGLGNVPNIDTTNANNITSGTLSGSRLPYGTVANTTAQGNDSRLTDAREWSASTVNQSVAQAGTDTTRYAWTSQRVRDNVSFYTQSFTLAEKSKLANLNSANYLPVGGTSVNSQLLDNLSPSVAASNNTIVQRHSAGYVYVNYLNTTPNTVSSGVTQVCVETGNDGFIRHGTPGAILGFIGATTLSTPNTPVIRDGAGDVHARLFRSEYDSTNSNIGFIMTQIDTATNNYLRPSTPAQFRSAVTDAYYLGLTAQATDSDMLDGLHAGSFIRSDINSTSNGRIVFTNSQSSNLNTNSAYGGGLELRANGSGATAGAAYMCFHRPGAYAVYFGFSTQNQLEIGGWSMGNTTHKIWHAGNDGSGSGLDADLWDGWQRSTYLNQALRNDSTPTFGNLTVTGVIYADEIRDRTGTQLVLNCGESEGKVTGQTGELVYINAEGGLAVNTPTVNNWGSGYAVNTAIITGNSIVLSGQQVWHSGNDGSGSGLDADLWDGWQRSTYLDQSVSTTANPTFGNNLNLVGTSPSIKLQDTNSRILWIHNNNGSIYILSNKGSGNSWSGTYPARWNDITEEATFWGATVWTAANFNPNAINAQSLNNLTSTQFLRADTSDSISGNLTVTGVIYANEIRDRTGTQLVLNCGESEGKVTGQTGELVYINAEGGLAVNTPTVNNWGSGYAVNTAIITGNSIVLSGQQVWHSGNDGSGSGLDADLWDGWQRSTYLNQAVKTDSTPTFGNLTVNGDIDIQNNAIVTSNANSSNIDHLWHDDGANAWNFCSDTSYKSVGNSAIQAGRFNLFYGTTQMGDIGAQDTSWFRINQATNRNIYTPRLIRADGGFQVAGKTFITADGNTLYENSVALATKYIRKDTEDTINVNTRWADSKEVRLGSGADGRFFHSGSNLHLRNFTGHNYYQNYKHGGGHYFQSEDANGTNRALCYMYPDDYGVLLYHKGSARLGTTVHGIDVYGSGHVNCTYLSGDFIKLEHPTNAYIDLSNNSGVRTARLIVSDGSTSTYDGQLKIESGSINLYSAGDGANSIVFFQGNSATKKFGLNTYSNNYLYLQQFTESNQAFEGNIIRFSLSEVRHFVPLVNGSSRHIKDIKGSIPDGLDLVNRLNPVVYNYKGQDNTEVGLIAEDVPPESHLVYGSGSDMAIDYTKLPVYMIDAIKQLTKRIEVLEENAQKNSIGSHIQR